MKAIAHQNHFNYEINDLALYYLVSHEKIKSVGGSV